MKKKIVFSAVLLIAFLFSLSFTLSDTKISAQDTLEDYIEATEEAIANLPERITPDDIPAFAEAFRLAIEVRRLGGQQEDVEGLERLFEAAEEVNNIVERLYEITNLRDVNIVDWQDGETSFKERFEDPDSWYAVGESHHTINGDNFDHLKVWSRGTRDLSVAPQWIDFDLSDRDYNYLSGQIGIVDASTSISYPPAFRIYGEIEGNYELLFEVDGLYRNEPAYFYFIDVSDVDTIRYELEADVVSGNRWTNRIGLVEPMLLTQDGEWWELLVEDAVAAIDELPDEITSGAREAINSARSLVDEALDAGAEEADITNLDILIAAEEALADLWDPGDVNGDGVINVEDVILVMQSILGLAQLEEWQQEAADVDGDGVINVDDVILIMQYVLGLITEFPVEN